LSSAEAPKDEARAAPQAYILPESIIYTDEWPAYRELDEVNSIAASITMLTSTPMKTCTQTRF
jgi:hypothetical protein